MNRTLVRVLNRLGMIPKVNVLSKSYINDKTVKIPLLKGTGLPNFYISEPWMIEVLKIVIPIDPKRFVDVGVNVGQTLLKLRSVSTDIDYIGFEPNSDCVHYVNNLIELNGFKDTRIVPVGIADKTMLAELNFYNEEGTDDTASILQEFRPDQKPIRKAYVPIFSSPEIQKTVNMDDISILKVDVEGAELEVIQGFYEDIKAKDPIILIEILPTYTDDNQYRIERQDEIVRLLKEANYSIFHLKKAGPNLGSFVELETIQKHDDITDCDYVMVPASKKEAFLNQVNKHLTT